MSVDTILHALTALEPTATKSPPYDGWHDFHLEGIDMAIPYWIDRSSHGDAPIVELGPERDWAVVKLACDSMRQCIEGEIIEADMADDLAARIHADMRPVGRSWYGSRHPRARE